MTEFKKIEGFDGYWVSNEGDVWSGREQVVNPGSGRGFKTIIHDSPLRKLKASTNTTNGYPFVSLHKNGKQHSIKVHKLVLEAFHGPKPFRGAMCRHLDGNNTNNKADNLCWGTASENMQDKLIHGTSYHGEDFWSSKFTKDQVLEIRAMPYENGLFTRLAKEYDVQVDSIRRLYYGDTWKHLPGANDFHVSEQVVREILLEKPRTGLNDELAKKYNVSNVTIINIRTGKSHTDVASELPRWEPFPNRFTDDQVRDIRSREPYRGFIKDLAKEFGVSRVTIRKVRNRKTYTHVE